MKKTLLACLLKSVVLAPSLMAMNDPVTVVHEEREPLGKHFPRYVALEEALRDTSFDPYEHAINLSKMRLNYALTAKKLLLSTNISVEEKIRVAEKIDCRVTQYIALSLEGKKALQNQHKKFLSKYSHFQDVELRFALAATDLAIQQWRYLHQSLVNLQGSEAEVDGAQYLMKEALFASISADVDIESFPNHTYYIDECFFTRSLADTLGFYLFTKNKIEPSELGIAHLSICRPISPKSTDFRGLGLWLQESILDPVIKAKFDNIIVEDPITCGLGLIRSLDLNNYLGKQYAVAKGNLIVQQNHLIIEKNSNLVCFTGDLANPKDSEDLAAFAEYARNQSNAGYKLQSNFYHISRNHQICDFRSELRSLDHFLIPGCVGCIFDNKLYSQALSRNDVLRDKLSRVGENDRLSLEEIIQRIEKEREKAKLSFLTSPKEKKGSAQKKTGQGKKKKNAKQEQKTPVATIQSSTPTQETKERAALAKQRRKEIIAKKEADKSKKREEREAEIEKRMETYDRNVEAASAALKDISFKFEEAWEPTIEELELYKLIWSSKKETDQLSWAELSSRLKSFGWGEDGRGGSSVLLLPPNWLEHVTAKGEGALNLNRAGMLLDHPHLRAVNPMPDYVFYFLRESLERNVGLSEIMIEALMQHVKSKGGPLNSNN